VVAVVAVVAAVVAMVVTAVVMVVNPVATVVAQVVADGKITYCNFKTESDSVSSSPLLTGKEGGRNNVWR
jgi:hypothetical protein